MKLKEFKITNFRGIKNLVMKPGMHTVISGKNATGKSTVKNAWYWLLFGKDSEDRKDCNIFPMVNEQIEKGQNVLVSAVVEHNGKTYEIGRELLQRWEKPRGQAEEEYRGTETNRYIDGLKVPAKDYDSFIASICDETLFKTLSNVRFFNCLHWEEQRKILFQIAGDVDMSDFVNPVPDSDFETEKKKIAVAIKDLKKRIAEIPIRISQTKDLTPEAEDFTEIEKQLLEKTEQLKANTEQGQPEAIRSVQMALDIARHEEAAQLAKENSEYQKYVSELTNSWKAKCDAIREDIGKKNDKILTDYQKNHELWSNAKKQYETTLLNQSQIALKEKELDELRNKYKDVSEKVFEPLKCPLGYSCNQLTGEGERTKFEEARKRKIETMTAEANGIKADIESLLSEKKYEHPGETPAPPQYLNAVIPELVLPAQKLSEEVKKLSEVVEEKRLALENVKNNYQSEIARQEQQRRLIGNEIKELQSRLAKRAQIEQSNAEIERLNQELKELNILLSKLEKREFEIKKYQFKYIERVADKVNSMFETVTFKLFDQTLDGNVFDCCICHVEGIPYQVANTASQINGGIEIINVLSEKYGISIPLFIDNAEAVNNLTPTWSQVFEMRVTDENELTVKTN
jgi:DNA repair exonuclease SbcCD ATPase subunit